MNKREGFTIVELVVAVFLLVLVFGFALQLLVFVQGHANRWQNGNDLAQVARRFHSTMYHDIQENGLVFETDSMDIRIPVPAAGESKYYAYEEGKLSRSGMALLPEFAMLDSIELSLSFREVRIGKDTLFTLRSDSAYTVHWQPPDTLHYSLKQFTFSGQIRSGKHTEQVHFTKNFRYHAFHTLSPTEIFGAQPDSANFSSL